MLFKPAPTVMMQKNLQFNFLVGFMTDKLRASFENKPYYWVLIAMLGSTLTGGSAGYLGMTVKLEEKITNLSTQQVQLQLDQAKMQGEIANLKTEYSLVSSRNREDIQEIKTQLNLLISYARTDQQREASSR